MTTNGKVTSLTFLLTTETGSKNITKAEFNFSGEISVGQAAKLVNNFKDLTFSLSENETKNVSETINVPITNNFPEMKNNSGLEEKKNVEEETDSDDEMPELDSDNENFHSGDRNISNMLYPIRGIPILLNNVGHYRSNILNAWKTYSSVVVTSSEVRDIYGHQLTHYRVVFPAEKRNTFPLSYQCNKSSLFRMHSYPVCSCPAYYFNNNRLLTGMCKHIYSLLLAIGIDISKITWENRPHNLPLLLKNEGLDEYKWIPQPPVILQNVQQNIEEVNLSRNQSILQQVNE
jgi:hypothetical protein